MQCGGGGGGGGREDRSVPLHEGRVGLMDK